MKSGKGPCYMFLFAFFVLTVLKTQHFRLRTEDFTNRNVLVIHVRNSCIVYDSMLPNRGTHDLFICFIIVRSCPFKTS